MHTHRPILVAVALTACASPDKKAPAPELSDLMQPASAALLAEWSPDGLQAAEDYWARMGTTAVVIVQHGAVVAAWGDVERPVQCHSVRKSFLGALFGTPVEQGVIDLDHTLEALSIDDAVPPSLSVAEQQATVRHLLQSRSGVYHPAAWETPEMEAERPARESHQPGTYWFYNNWDFNALGTVYNQQAGRDLFVAFRDDIAEPTGMAHFSLDHTRYAWEDTVSEHPVYSFELSSLDRARFGLLFLRNGDWDGQQVIPEAWVQESTQAWSDAGSGVGYGYLWWISVDGWHLGSRFDGTPYSARGWGGQYIVVIPERDLVIVHTADLSADEELQPDTSFQELFALILAAEHR